MLQKRSPREKELLRLSELIGESHRRLKNELVTVEKLMRLLIFNAGENYSENLEKNTSKKGAYSKKF